MASVPQGGRHAASAELTNARILLVDDDADTLILMSRALNRAGCKDVVTAEDAVSALRVYAEQKPDLVVMDLQLPGSNGLELMEEMHESDPSGRGALVLMVTGNQSEQAKRTALARGVADFLPKNSDTTEFVLRVQNLLHLNGLKHEIEFHRESLEATVLLRTGELQRARSEVLGRLALAAEYRDDATGEHTKRVGALSAQISEHMKLPTEFTQTIGSAALLHDLGKIGIPDSILLKRGKLTDEEFDRIKSHPEIGASILEGCDEPLLQMAQEIALTHHERWDGSGYPRGLAREEIPLSGRIVAVADVFDAMTHERPYKGASPVSTAIEAIAAESHRHFDPDIVNAFLAVVRADTSEAPSA